MSHKQFKETFLSDTVQSFCCYPRIGNPIKLCKKLNVNVSAVSNVDELLPVKPLSMDPKLKEFLESVPCADSNCTGVDMYRSYLDKFKSANRDSWDPVVRTMASCLTMHAYQRVAEGNPVEGDEINMMQPEPPIDDLIGMLLKLVVGPKHCVIKKPRCDLRDLMSKPSLVNSVALTSEADWGIGTDEFAPSLVTLASETTYRSSCTAQSIGEAMLFSLVNYRHFKEVRPLPVLQIRGSYIGALVGIFDQAYMESFLNFEMPQSPGQAIQLQPVHNSLLGFNLLTQTGRTQTIDMLCRLATVTRMDSLSLLTALDKRVVKE